MAPESHYLMRSSTGEESPKQSSQSQQTDYVSEIGKPMYCQKNSVDLLKHLKRPPAVVNSKNKTLTQADGLLI